MLQIRYPHDIIGTQRRLYMRISNDFNRNSSSSYYNNTPSFGAVYTKGSIKLLKSFIPDVISEDGFEFAQKAINNLSQVGKHKDNLILKLKDTDDLGLGHLEFHAKHTLPILNSFSKIDIPVDGIGLKDSQRFELLTNFVNSDKFIPAAEKALEQDDTLPQPQRIRNMINEKTGDIYQKIENKVNNISDEIFCISENGDKREWTVWENMKEFCKNAFSKHKNPNQYNDTQQKQANILAEMINKLPTLNI